MYLFLFIIFVLILVFFNYGWTYRFKYNLPPGVFGLPMIGQSIEVGAHPIEFFSRMNKKYGEIYLGYFLSRPTIFVSGKDNVEKILRLEPEFISVSEALPANMLTILGFKNILNLDYDSSRLHKKVLASVLQRKDSLAHIMSVIQDIIIHHVDKWAGMSYIDNWYHKVECLAFDCAGYIIWADKEPESDRKMRAFNAFLVLNDGIASLPINYPGFTFHKALKRREELVEIINESREELKKRRNDDQDQFLGTVGLYLDEETPNDDLQIAMLFAAHHTISTLMIYTIIELEKRPEILSKVRIEIDRVIGNKQHIEYGDLRKLDYLNAVQKEVMRFHSVGMAFRRITKSFQYKGYDFPEEFLVVPTYYPIHSDPQVFQNPEQFKPERFIAAGDSESVPFYGFGYGSHLCLGRQIAFLESAMVLVHLCRTCDWKRDPKQDMSKVSMIGGTKPKDGYKAFIEKRDATKALK